MQRPWVMGPYPLELRQRIVEAYLRGEGTYPEVAERFCVAPNTVLNLVQRFRATRSFSPRPHGGGTHHRIPDGHLPLLAQWLEENNDLVQQELIDKYANHTSVRVSQSTMSRALERLELTRKKKRSMPTNTRTPKCSKSAKPSSRTWRE